tara:strand:+ start:853 stop:1044 length:192 start_codon:yes stop_codon:yes gene_type:complete
MTTKKNKLSISITQDTLDRIEELRRTVNIRAIDNRDKLVSLSGLVEEILRSGLDNKSEALWTL